MTSACPIELRTGPIEEHHLPGGFLHICVFGPGEGEAILVRTPDGRIGIIDGCGEDTRDVSSLHSLVKRLLGKKKLLFACLTHPHEDHYLGFAELIQKFPPEHLWWSGSSERKFFWNYLKYLKKKGADKKVDGTKVPPARSLGRVVAEIRKLTEGRAANRPRAQHLSDWKLILDHTAEAFPSVQIASILPSTNSVCMAERDTAQAVLTHDDAEKRKFDPNRISAALLITWRNTRVLLGGDALNNDSSGFGGWDNLQFNIGRVALVKVAHHASKEAHSGALWASMSPQLAVVTCFNHANGKQPPRPEMLKTILQTPAKLVLCSKPKWWDTTSHGLTIVHGNWEPSRAASLPIAGHRVTTRSLSRPVGIDNATVVRLDENGSVVHVGLHGEARELLVPPTVPAK